MREQKAGKLVPLEGLRGVAAVIVMLGHMVRGLVPPGPGGWDGLHQFHSWLLNGGAAVTVFFVLSGFILSLPFANDRSPLRVLTALLKRWPRLAALTTIACLFSWALIVLSQDNYQQAAAVTGNEWMASHFNAPLKGHEISWMAALRDGLYQAFLSGGSRFDSPLWTMRIELFGSFAIFLMAPVLFELQHWPLRLAIVGGVINAAGSAFPLTYVSDFLVGTVLAMLFAENRMPKFSNWSAAGIGLGGVYLLQRHREPPDPRADKGDSAHWRNRPFRLGCKCRADHHGAVGQPVPAPCFLEKLGNMAGAAVVSNLPAARADHALRRRDKHRERGRTARHYRCRVAGGGSNHDINARLRPPAGLGG